jgi:hypothetical protein
MEMPSPFQDIPAGKEDDFRYLLERVYWALVTEFRGTGTALKGKAGENAAKILKLEGAVCHLEHCPCERRLDAGKTCGLWVLEKEVLRNKWRNIGLYTGIFSSGAFVYYLASLLLTYWRIR